MSEPGGEAPPRPRGILGRFTRQPIPRPQRQSNAEVPVDHRTRWQKFSDAAYSIFRNDPEVLYPDNPDGPFDLAEPKAAPLSSGIANLRPKGTAVDSVGGPQILGPARLVPPAEKPYIGMSETRPQVKPVLSDTEKPMDWAQETDIGVNHPEELGIVGSKLDKPDNEK